VALAAVALALLGIVGLASATFDWHATHRGLGAPGAALRALAATGGVVLVIALLLIWAETPKKQRRVRKRRTIARNDFDELGGAFWTAGRTAAVSLGAVALFCLAALPLLSPSSTPSPPPINTRTITTTTTSTPSHRDETRRAGHVDLGWLALPMAIAFAILFPAAFLIRRRLSRAPDTVEDPGALGRAVRASISALESERDPRKAILRAYARMEEAFCNIEIVRARHETASEFMGRAMRRLRVSADSAAALTGSFEEARFSTHTITESDRDVALASLHRVERELAGRP
jgi:multisubunit Na+/H+ antiporter MnhB subunit